MNSWYTPGLGFAPAADGSVLEILNGADPAHRQSHENWWESGTWVVNRNPQGQSAVSVGVTTDFLRLCGNTPIVADFHADVPLVDSLDEVMKPVTAASGAVRDAIQPSVFVLPTTSNLAMSVRDTPAGALEDGTVVALRADLVLGGRVIASARWFQVAGASSIVGRPVLMRFGDFESTWQNNGPMTSTLEELIAQGCVVRFSTDEEMALAAFGYDKYWRGSFEVPLKELVK